MKTNFTWKENYKNVLAYADSKAKYPWWKLVLLGILGGAFIGIGYIGYIAIETASVKATWDPVEGEGQISLLAKFLAAGIFPVGLMLVVFLGGSIFTSECLSSLSFINKRTKIGQLLKGWGIILLSNFVGAALIAGLVYWSHIFANQYAHYVIADMVKGKAGLQWYVTIGSAIICNLIVAGTVWITTVSKHVVAQIFLVWFPITLFVLSGTQHVVANMFAFSIGGMETPDAFSWFNAIFENLIPAALGNWIGGAVIIPLVYTALNYKSMKEIKFENLKDSVEKELGKSTITKKVVAPKKKVIKKTAPKKTKE